MTNTVELPPLPEPHLHVNGPFGLSVVPMFTADQMREYRAAQAQPAASGEPADDCAERVAFYEAFSAAEKATGHKPSHYDVWLMARGLMTVDGRSTAAGVS